MAYLAKLIARLFHGFKITKSYEAKINGKFEIINIISNKGRLVTIPSGSWGEIFVSNDVLKQVTNPELNSVLFHEIYHRYNPKIKKLDKRFNKIFFPKDYLTVYQRYFPYFFKFMWQKEIKADLFSTLKSNKKFFLNFLDKKVKFKINLREIDIHHPPTELRKWIIRKYGF